MARRITTPTEAGLLHAVFTDRGDGDFTINADQPGLERRRRAVVDRPWSWLRQVHGDVVYSVAQPGDHAGLDGDGLVTERLGCPLAIMTADCAPVVLAGDHAFAVVHAGWRGLTAGIVERAAGQLNALGAKPVASLVGPCINPGFYEFGAGDLAKAIEALGPTVEAETAWGTPALDVPAAVVVALQRVGWPAPTEPPACTSDEAWYSHRSRGDAGRQAAVAWLEPVAP